MASHAPPRAPLTIRRALPEESAALTALAVRSKAHWGYSEAFMLAVRPELEIGAELVATASCHVAERDGAVVGVYVLSVEPEGPTLRDLWVDPSAMRTGVGAALWAHMLTEARRLGYPTVRIESDPNAEAFYLRMGAVVVGSVPSKALAGRILPLMEIALA